MLILRPSCLKQKIKQKNIQHKLQTNLPFKQQIGLQFLKQNGIKVYALHVYVVYEMN